MPLRNSLSDYRYAYQGQEKDTETGKEAFELRLWDARIGRWLTTDPAGQYHSPYMGMGNSPINGIDPDGAFWGELWNWAKGNGWNTNAELDAQYTLVPLEGIQLNEVVVSGKGRSKGNNHIDFGANSHITPSFGFSQDLGGMGTTTNGGLALPQDFGSWNSTGSDGRQWIGCMSCHGNNGAYRTLAYNSPSRYTGLSIAATINLITSPGQSVSRSPSTNTITYVRHGNLYKQAYQNGRFAGPMTKVVDGQAIQQMNYYKSLGLQGTGAANSFTPSFGDKIPSAIKWTAGVGGGTAVGLWQINNRGK